MSIHKDAKTKKYCVKFRVNGKSNSRVFHSLHDARLFESKMQLEKLKDHCTKTYKEVATLYLDNLKKESSFLTYSKNKIAMDRIILPNFEDKLLTEYSDLDCKNFRDYIGSTNYSTTYKNYILNKFKAVFKYAVLWYKLDRDPTLRLTNFKKSFEEKMRLKKKESEIWNDDEFNKFINYVDNYTYKMFYILLYYTGMRLGELQAITWNDFKDNYLSVYKSIPKATEDGKLVPKETKNTSSIRNVSLPDSICKKLCEYKELEKQQPGFNEDWYIFGRAEPLPRTNINRYKDTAIELSGVKRITIHEFRHSHASNLINNKMSIIGVSRRLGHADVNMTLKVYAHLFKESDDEIINFLETKSNNIE